MATKSVLIPYDKYQRLLAKQEPTVPGQTKEEETTTDFATTSIITTTTTSIDTPNEMGSLLNFCVTLFWCLCDESLVLIDVNFCIEMMNFLC